MENKKQKLVVEFECPDAFIPDIMKEINKALMIFESVQKPTIKRE